MDFVSACLDEIALEGLDGITLSALWTRLKLRKPEFPLKLDENCQEFLWSRVIAVGESLSFYELVQPRPELVVFDRNQFIDPTYLVLSEQLQKDGPPDIYPFCPVSDKERSIIGSCALYHSRRDVTDVVRDSTSCVMNLASVQERWGERLVIVGSQRLRMSALLGYNQVDLVTLSDKEYYCLERIGRSRYHGEITFGANSLKALNVTPKTLFYVRKRLRRFQLIALQPLMTRSMSGGVTHCTLIHLTRFFVEQRQKWSVNLEQLTTCLGRYPMQRATSFKLREDMGFSASMYKRVLSYAGKYVRTYSIAYEEYSQSLDLHSGEVCKTQARKFHIVHLVKPYVYRIQRPGCSTAGEFDDDEDNDDDSDVSDNEKNLVNPAGQGKPICRPLVYEKPMLRQVFEKIRAAEMQGLTIPQISATFSIVKLDARAITKSLEKKGVVAGILHEEGKKCTRRYISIQHLSGDAKQLKPPKLGALTATDKDDQMQDDLLQIVAERSVLNASLNASSSKESYSGRMSVRKLKRQQLVVELLKSNKVINQLKTIELCITEAEKTKHKTDRKTIQRLLKELERRGEMKTITKLIKLPDGSEKKKEFYCDIDITEESKQFVLSLQNVLQSFTKVEETPRPPQPPPPEKKPPKPTFFPLYSVPPPVEEEKLDLKYDPEASKRYGFSPRCCRMRDFHEYMWCLVYSSESVPPSAADDGNDIPSWFEAVSKVAKMNCPAGWCCLGDAISNMPVSVFCRIVRISFVIPELEEFLSDEQRRDTPFCKLPTEMRRGLSLKRKHVANIDELCYRLSELGLLSFGKNEYRKREQAYVYVHRIARFMETSQARVSEESARFHEFNFESFVDVQRYWKDLMIECLNTRLENVNTSMSSRISNKNTFREDGCHQNKTIEEIIDNGRIPGDGLGAAGFDSILFLHLRRNWIPHSKIDTVKLYTVIREENHPLLKPVKKRESLSMQASRVTSCKELLLPVDVTQKATKTGDQVSKPAKPGVGSVKVVLGVKPNKGGRGVKRKLNNSEPETETKKRTFTKKKTKAALDSECDNAMKDLAAKNKMNNLRVSWSALEDSLLLLCEVANRFMTGPSSRFCLVRSYVIRDILHENIEASHDKSSKACNRRIVYMMKSKTTAQNVNLFLSEALVDKELVNEFRAGKKYVWTKEKENEVTFRRCLSKLREKFGSSGKSEEVLNLPDSLSELQRQFSMHGPTVLVPRTLQDSSSVHDVQFSVMRNFIHAALGACDKIGRAHELCQVAESFPSAVVNDAFENLMDSRIVTKIKKSDTKAKRAAATFGTIGCYKLSQKYLYTWNSWYPNSVFDKSFNTLEALLENKDAGSPSTVDDKSWLKLDEGIGSCLVIVALMAKRQLNIKITMPENIVILDSIKTGKEFEALQKPRQQAVEGDEDSDAEEERIIEEAERKRGEHKIPMSEQSSSRSVLWLYKCQYIHSAKQSAKFSNVSDNIFVKSCDVHIQPVEQPPQQLSSCSASNVDTHAEVSNWNRQHVLLHPRTVNVLLKTLRRLVPDHLDVVLDSPPSSVPAEKDEGLFAEDQGTGSEHGVQLDRLVGGLQCDTTSSAIVSVYGVIESRNYLGITERELKISCSNIERETLIGCLAVLCDVQVVLRVGVSVFRYVALCHAKCWLVCIDKNIKGRGNVSARGGEMESYVDLRKVWESRKHNHRMVADAMDSEVPLATRSILMFDQRPERIQKSASSSLMKDKILGKRGAPGALVLSADSAKRSKLGDAVIPCDGELRNAVRNECTIPAQESAGTSGFEDETMTLVVSSDCLSSAVPEPTSAPPFSSIATVVSEASPSTQLHVDLIKGQTSARCEISAPASEILSKSETSVPLKGLPLAVLAAVNYPIASPRSSASICQSRFLIKSPLSPSPGIRAGPLMFRVALVSPQNSAVLPVGAPTISSTTSAGSLMAVDGPASAASPAGRTGLSNMASQSFAVSPVGQMGSCDGTSQTFTPVGQNVLSAMTSQSFAVSPVGRIKLETAKSQSETHSVPLPVPLSQSGVYKLEYNPSAFIHPAGTDTGFALRPIVQRVSAVGNHLPAVSSAVQNSPAISRFPRMLPPAITRVVRGADLCEVLPAATSIYNNPTPTPMASMNMCANPAVTVQSLSNTSSADVGSALSIARPCAPAPINLVRYVATGQQVQFPQAAVGSAVNFPQTARPPLSLTAQNAGLRMITRFPLQGGSVMAPVPSVLPSSASNVARAGCPLRIRLDASQLGSNDDQGALVQRIQGLLAQAGSLRPGASVRIRFMPNSGSQHCAHPSSAPSSLPITSVAPEQSSATLHPLHTHDIPLKPGSSSSSDMNPISSSLIDPYVIQHVVESVDETGKMCHRAAIKEERCESSVSAQLPSEERHVDKEGIAGCSSVIILKSESASPRNDASDKVAQLDGTADESPPVDDSPPPSGSSKTTDVPTEAEALIAASLRSPSRSVRRSSSKVFELEEKASTRTSTYKTVRLVPRPWRTPEGTVNHAVFKTILKGILSHIMENPGITSSSLDTKYAAVLQPVSLNELLEVLEEIGCVRHRCVRRIFKPSLFSSRAQVIDVADDLDEDSSKMFTPSVDCILKLGQFLAQL